MKALIYVHIKANSDSHVRRELPNGKPDDFQYQNLHTFKHTKLNISILH